MRKQWKCLPLWGMVLSLMLLTGCEKVVFDEEESDPQGNVTISVMGVEVYRNEGQTRAVKPLTEACSRICFVLYQDGKKVKGVSQKSTDKDYGTVSMTLDAGTYQVLVLGHCSLGNPSLSTPTKIQFDNAPPVTKDGTGYSDTFYYYGDLTVGEQQTYQFMLTRATAMFRFVTADVKPASVKRMWFMYEGGSGALDATTGYGCVNSTQMVVYDYTDNSSDGKALTFSLFTFLHHETDNVSFTVRALDASGSILYEKEFKSVAMQRNTITQYSGNFFGGKTDPDPTPDPGTDPDPTPDPGTDPDPTPDPGTDPDPTPITPSYSFLVDTDWAAVREFTF